MEIRAFQPDFFGENAMSKNKKQKAMMPATTSAIIYKNIEELKPFEGNARTHDDKQITKLAASIKRLGFQGAIVTNEQSVILAGHGRLEAAKRLGLKELPTVVAAGLSPAEQRAFVLSDNKLAQLAGWDQVVLKTEVEFLLDQDFEIECTGFTTAEVDLLLDGLVDPHADDEYNVKPEDIVDKTLVARKYDVWHLGKHRIVCGDALDVASYGDLMGKDVAQMCITDPPYNVKIAGHVCGKGQVQHEEFAMASGEMSSGEFTDFLAKAFTNIASYTQEGGIVYSFMDWRHMLEIQMAAKGIFGDPRQLCVWKKDNAGMGTFYRSHHELVYVFKNGDGAHVNNFELGQHGRYRTNVWDYAGVNTLKGKAYKLLELHPTVKPVGMIADAIRDCSDHNGIILDPFAGSGTIIMAAERTGRFARAIELEPKYVDVAIRRWERLTGNLAKHDQSKMTFQEREDFFANGGEEEPYVRV